MTDTINPDYYKDAPDLNIPEKTKESREKREGREGRAGGRGKKTGEKVRLKIKLGDQEGITPKRLLGIINDVTGDKSISIGSIEITSKFSFFDVYADQVNQLLTAFSRNSNLQVLEAKGSKSFEERRGERRPFGDDWGGRRERRDERPARRERHPDFSDKPWRKGRERNYSGARKK